MRVHWRPRLPDAQLAVVDGVGRRQPLRIARGPLGHLGCRRREAGAAKAKGGFEGASLDDWRYPLSADQVATMSGGPAYDRFCTFVTPAPEMSPAAAALPDTAVYASPPGRYFHTLDYEPVERMLVLFGGTKVLFHKVSPLCAQDVIP